MSLREELVAIFKLLAPSVGNVALMLETPTMKLKQLQELEVNLRRATARVSAIVAAAEEKKRNNSLPASGG